MFSAPPEVRTAAGYLLVLSVAVVFYMRLAFSREGTDVAVRTSLVRIAVSLSWGVAIAVYVLWPDLPEYWNFFMFPHVRWFTTVPAAVSILLMIWAMRSRLQLGADGKIAASGPYAWCRYPFDAALALFFVAVSLLCGNWLIIAITLFLIMLHRIGVPYELEGVRRARLGAAYDDYAERAGWFLPSAMPVKKTQYQVPSRFGLTAILGLLTILAIIFGSLRAADAPPVVYLFVGSEIVAICLAQILVGFAPRGGSTLTGAILLPFWVYLMLETPPLPASFSLVMVVTIRSFVFLALVVFGGLLGYCVGTLAAGFFLMMDLIEPWLLRDRAAYPLHAAKLPGQIGPHNSE